MSSSAASITVPDQRSEANIIPLDLASLRFLNEKAIREYALRCSARFRANKFTRVGEDFIDEVKADVEATVRELRKQCATTLHAPLYAQTVEDPPDFVTGAMLRKIEVEFNGIVARIIQNKVQRQPTVGKTLGRTR